VLNCRQCKRFTERPFQQANDSDQPKFRLQENVTPFENIGIETMSELHINDETHYILLVTDLIIRPIGLEVLTDMTIEELVYANQRLAARRSSPTFHISGNAKQFQLLFETLKRESRKKIKWKFIPNRCLWQGRKDYATHKAVFLYQTFHGMALSDSAFRTAVAEITDVLNSRPLMYASEDGNDGTIIVCALANYCVLPSECNYYSMRSVHGQECVSLLALPRRHHEEASLHRLPKKIKNCQEEAE